MSVLVTGATGKQGGAVARALLRSGQAVRALVRDPAAERAFALARLGATLVPGDLDDPESVAAAAAGARAVFSVQMPDLADLMGDSELRHGRAIVDAARAAGVEQVVHTSVSGAATVGVVDAARWGEHMAHYWRSKAAVEELVRAGGFRRVTILRPSTFMENLVRPSFYFADGNGDRFLVALDADIPRPFVAVDDIGAAAAAAFADPARFDGVELELAGELISLREIAAVMTQVLGTPIEPPSTTAEEAIAQGLMPEFARSQEFMDAHPAPARPELAQALGLPTTGFREWAAATLVAAPAR